MKEDLVEQLNRRKQKIAVGSRQGNLESCGNMADVFHENFCWNCGLGFGMLSYIWYIFTHPIDIYIGRSF